VKLLVDIACAKKEHIIMKFPLKLTLAGTLLVFVLTLFSSFIPNETPKNVVATTVEELIIQVPKSTAKNQAAIESAIIASKGVEFKGYCSSLQVYMMLVDRSVQANNQFVEDIMKSQELDFYIKEGSTIAGVKAACGMDANDQPQNSQQ
jgi:hypothetical protein